MSFEENEQRKTVVEEGIQQMYFETYGIWISKEFIPFINVDYLVRSRLLLISIYTYDEEDDMDESGITGMHL